MNFTSTRELSNGSYLYLQLLNTPSEKLLSAVFLEPSEREKVDGFKLEIRKRQYLVARKIVQEHFGSKERIVYTPAGKPELKLSRNAISLSHSGDYLAVIIDGKREVGVDLQKYTVKMPRIVKRFVHEDEMAYISAESEMEYYHFLWCAKEAMFKWVEDAGIHFKENLRVDSFVLNREGEMQAHVLLKEKQYHLTLAYEKLNNYYLVYTFNR